MLCASPKVFIVLAVMLIMLAPLSGSAAEGPALRSLRIFWTDEPPVIDGKMDDSCWETAEIAGNFRIFLKPEEEPAQQTEVRAAYDATHLYLYYKLYDDQIDKLLYGPPEDMRDMLDFRADVFELFLDPGRTLELYYQFAASPTAARFDQSRKKGRPFQPDWRVATHIGDDYWAAEMAIPFTELVHAEEYHGTPRPGEVWGIQFCRSQGRLVEWTQWAPSRRSFHEPESFGKAIFSGRKEAPSLPVIYRQDEEPLRFGRGEVLMNSDVEVRIDYILSRDGRVVKKDGFTAESNFAIPWHITSGGRWDMAVDIFSGDNLVYTGRTFSTLPFVFELLETISTDAVEAKDKLIHLVHPESSVLRARIDNLLERAAPVLEMGAEPQNLTNEEWDGLLSEHGRLESIWRDLEFDVHLVQFYPDTPSMAKFTVGTAGPYEKIYPSTLYEGQPGERVVISSAGREYQSFQLLVMPFWADLKNVQVKFSDLEGENGRIGAGNFSWRIVDYVHLEEVLPDSGISEIQPDILLPGEPFELSAGELKSIYVDLYTPGGTDAGEYSGSVSVYAGGQTVKIPVLLTSHGFDLPEKTSLQHNLWFFPAARGWGSFYGVGIYGDKPYTTDIYRKQAEQISRYRVNPFCDDVFTMAPHLTMYYEGDGVFAFDFSKWKEFFDIGLEYGGNAFKGSLHMNLAALYVFHPAIATVIDRETGEKLDIRQWVNPWREKFDRGEIYYDEHPLWPQYLTQLTEFLDENRLLEISFFEIYDEPNANPRWVDMIRHHKWLRQHIPQMPLKNFGVWPSRRQAGKTSLGLHDVWAPQLHYITPDVLEEMQERRRRYGERYWFYTCSERYDADGNLTPYIYYHRPYIGGRMHSWFAWHMEADGMLIYAISDAVEANRAGSPEEKWPNRPWVDGRRRGTGTLIYPGPDYEVIPGIRLTSVRDGLQDYEYFAKLHALSAYLNEEDHPDLIVRVERALKIGPEIISDLYNWTKDENLLQEKKKEIAGLILEIKAWIEMEL